MDESLALDESSVSLHHLLPLSVNVEKELNLLNHNTDRPESEAAEAIETAIIGNNLRKGV